MPRPVAATSLPRTLSLRLTICVRSGRSESSLRPMSDSVRPFEDISTGLPGGPTACDASEAFVILTGTWSTPPEAFTLPTVAAVSRSPNGLTPLKSFCARPSQKLRKLKTALMTDGVLRPVVRRTGVSSTLNTGSSVANVWSSAGSPWVTPSNADGNTPCEPDTLVVSDRTWDAASFGSASLWNGKSAAVSWALGLKVRSPPRGLTWLRERLSAPALKWHVAHAVRPSAPACMSQNSALPSLTALDLLLMYVASSGGVGTGALSSAATSGVLRAPALTVPPAATHTPRPAHASARAIAARSAIRRPVAAEAAPGPPPKMTLRTNHAPPCLTSAFRSEAQKLDVRWIPTDRRPVNRVGPGVQRGHARCARPRRKVCMNLPVPVNHA